MEEVHELTIKPFRHIVDEANTALENAGANDIMRRAAKKLLREGEKAVKRIEPQCAKRYAEHKHDFLSALRDNNEIKELRTKLNCLVYGFDEFVEEDQFDVDKYTELQALTREVVLKIYEIVISMRIEVRKKPPPPFLNHLSPPASPGPPPLFPIPPTPSVSSLQSHKWPPSSPPSCPQKKFFRNVNYAPEELQSFRGRQPSSVDSVLASEYGSIACPSARSSVSLMPQRPNRTLQRRAIDFSCGYQRGNASELSYDEAEWRGLADHQLKTGLHSSHPSPLHLHTKLVPFSDEIICQNAQGANASIRQTNTPHHVHQSSLESGSTPHDPQRDTFGGAAHSRSSTNSPVESIVDPYLNNVRISDPYLNNVHISDSSQESAAVVEGSLVAATRHIDDGLIPVETDRQPSPPSRNLSQRDCSIGSSSSFYMRRGFCNGAKEVIAGGLGVRKTKRPVGLNGSSVVARCTGCFYELAFKDIENDLEKQNCGNLRHSGVGYRLRFLQKCHVHTKRPDDVLYGCVFCIRLGRTLDPSDATLFFNLKSLFSHLARHPRPLPEVPGIIVIDQPNVPAHYKNDYDLHFLKPPVSHPALEQEQKICTMPVGVAKEPARKLFGQRLLGDRTPALELVVGSRVTGLEFMAKYSGEWCMGWYDGVHASVPLDKLILQCPASSDIKMDGTSHIRAKARWKFCQKNKKETAWLKFDKDEVITNLSWSYPEHWCWSGTNAKGKWGIFPQAFLDMESVQELSITSSQRASNLNTEKNKSSSLLSRFSVRKTQGPPSIASSRS